MNKPLMAKATAVWLVDNTTLSFRQIADFVGMHELEIAGMDDESRRGANSQPDGIGNGVADVEKFHLKQPAQGDVFACLDSI